MDSAEFTAIVETLKTFESEIETHHDMLHEMFNVSLKLNNVIEGSNLPSNEKQFQVLKFIL